MNPNNRKCIIQSAQVWFDESRKAQKAGHMAEALLYMENAFNHTENALERQPSTKDSCAEAFNKYRDGKWGECDPYPVEAFAHFCAGFAAAESR